MHCVPDCGYVAVPTHQCSATKRFSHLCLQRGRRLEGLVKTTQHARSVANCGLLCLVTPTCLSTQFQTSENTCELNSHTVNTAGELDLAPGWIFISTNVC